MESTPGVPEKGRTDEAPLMSVDQQRDQCLEIRSIIPGIVQNPTNTICNHGEQLSLSELVQLSNLVGSDFDDQADRWFQSFCSAGRQQHPQTKIQHPASQDHDI